MIQYVSALCEATGADLSGTNRLTGNAFGETSVFVDRRARRRGACLGGQRARGGHGHVDPMIRGPECRGPGLTPGEDLPGNHDRLLRACGGSLSDGVGEVIRSGSVGDMGMGLTVVQDKDCRSDIHAQGVPLAARRVDRDFHKIPPSRRC